MSDAERAIGPRPTVPRLFLGERARTYQQGGGFALCGVRVVDVALALLEARAGSRLRAGVGVVPAVGRQHRCTAAPTQRFCQHDGQAAGQRLGHRLSRDVDQVAVVVDRGVGPVWRTEAGGEVMVGLNPRVQEKKASAGDEAFVLGRAR